MDDQEFYYRQGEAFYNDNVHTPMKDLPPTLGFGSSSSPFLESPQTVEKHVKFVEWSPSQGGIKEEARPAASSSLLLPSQFPPSSFNGLESSPPDGGRYVNSSSMPYDQGASPKPTQIKRVGRRGRPRKYDLKGDLDAQVQQPTIVTRTLPQTADHAVSRRSPVVMNRSAMGQPIMNHVMNPMITNQSRTQSMNPSMNQPFSQPVVQPAKHAHMNRNSSPVGAQPASKRKLISQKDTYVGSQVQSKKRSKTDVSSKASRGDSMLYASGETTNGVPLFSSRIFEIACNHQSNIESAQASALRGALAERDQKQRQFSTKGLRFNFSINMGGKACIDMTTPLTPRTPSRHGDVSKAESNGASLSLQSLSDDEDSESDAEPVSTDRGSIRTPPRFTSLGSSDAAAAFAKTLARSNDQGKGFMFLFPPVSTPDKHGQLTSFVPCTPRTPRVSMPFDENAFSMQMQTPPGAIYSYENPGIMYGTGMTPLMGSARGLN